VLLWRGDVQESGHLDPAPEQRVQFSDRGVGIMSSEVGKYLKFGGVTVVILLSLGYLAYTGVQDSKSYYVTIKELHTMATAPIPNACVWPEMWCRDRLSVRELGSSSC